MSFDFDLLKSRWDRLLNSSAKEITISADEAKQILQKIQDLELDVERLEPIAESAAEFDEDYIRESAIDDLEKKLAALVGNDRTIRLRFHCPKGQIPEDLPWGDDLEFLRAKQIGRYWALMTADNAVAAADLVSVVLFSSDKNKKSRAA